MHNFPRELKFAVKLEFNYIFRENRFVIQNDDMFYSEFNAVSMLWSIKAIFTNIYDAQKGKKQKRKVKLNFAKFPFGLCQTC